MPINIVMRLERCWMQALCRVSKQNVGWMDWIDGVGELRDAFLRKRMHAFGQCSNEREGGPCPNFGTFSRSAFLVIKGVYFFQNANNLNFGLFLGYMYIVYIVFVVLNLFQNLELRRRKKVVQIARIWGGGNISPLWQLS